MIFYDFLMTDVCYVNFRSRFLNLKKEKKEEQMKLKK